MIVWIQFLSSFWMTAIIWFVQIVHYPLFKYVSYDNRLAYQKQHMYLISWIVMPAMIIELSSLLLLGQKVSFSLQWIILITCLLVIWLSTFLLQVPYHQQLLQNPQDKVIIKLIQSNWIRTIIWTVKTVLILIWFI